MRISKYILSIAAISISCFFFQDSIACCGSDEEDTQPLLQSKHPLIKTQPESQRFSAPNVVAESQIGYASPLPEDNQSLSSRSVASLQSAGETTFNTSHFKPEMQEVAQNIRSSADVIDYLRRNGPTSDRLKSESSQLSWSLSSNDKDIESLLFLIFVNNDDPRMTVLEQCFKSQVSPGKSVRKTVIAPSLKTYIERVDLEFYKRLSGVFLYAHHEAEGKIFSVLGSNKEYSETIFTLPDTRHLFVLTGSHKSTTLAKKKARLLE